LSLDLQSGDGPRSGSFSPSQVSLLPSVTERSLTILDGGRLRSHLVISTSDYSDLRLGTFGLASGLLGEKFDNAFFKVVSVVDTIVVLLFWLVVAFKCIVGAIDGSLFFGDRPSPGAEKAKKENGSPMKKREYKGSSPSGSSTMVPSDV